MNACHLLELWVFNGGHVNLNSEQTSISKKKKCILLLLLLCNSDSKVGLQIETIKSFTFNWMLIKGFCLYN